MGIVCMRLLQSAQQLLNSREAEACARLLTVCPEDGVGGLFAQSNLDEPQHQLRVVLQSTLVSAKTDLSRGCSRMVCSKCARLSLKVSQCVIARAE